MNESKRPIWHPLENLPLIASLIDGQLEDCQKQLRNLDPEDTKAPVLDDALVQRIIRLCTEQQEMLPVFSEQLDRWKNERPSDEEQLEIERLERQIDQYGKILARLLELAREYQDFTIEKVLAKDDVEVALDVLSGKMRRWR
jgi:hypothetical protein